MERALLSALAVDPTRIPEVTLVVSGMDFSDPSLGHFFDVMATAFEAGVPVGDPKALLYELRKHRVDPSVASTDYLGRLFLGAGSAKTAAHYAARVRAASVLRAQQALGLKLAELAAQHGADPAEISIWAESQLHSLGIGEATTCRSIGEVAGEFARTMRARKSHARAVPSGIGGLDQITGGFFPGELVILAARTGVGKTALALQIAAHSASLDHKVLFVSLEMRDAELAGRMLCGAAKVTSRVMRSGSYTTKDIAAVEAEALKIDGTPLHVWAPPRATVPKIRAMAKRVRALYGLGLVIVDYLGLVQPSDRKAQRYEQVGEITGGLKALAKECNVPVLALSQLNRLAETEEPRLSHLRESGSIEQDADVVIFVSRTEKLPDSTGVCKARLNVAKHRHSAVGSVDVAWLPEKTRFEDRVFYDYTATTQRHEPERRNRQRQAPAGAGAC
jgi:replicative DNA helicase